jgi:arginyl-tRNA synthetase
VSTADTLRRALERAAWELGVEGEVGIQLERPRNPEHGDLATNAAMVAAGRLRRPPREVAGDLIARLDLRGLQIAGAEIAGPGFINFRFAQAGLQSALAEVLSADARFGRQEAERKQRVMVEFVSANPTGPLHVAHGRGAALGDAIASLLEWTGHDVTREFYVNDAGLQIDRLAESLEARWRELHGEAAAIPEGGYLGEYLKEMAAQVDAVSGDALRAMEPAARVSFLRSWATARLRDEQDADLRVFGVHFDAYYEESRLYAEGRIEEALAELSARGLTYEQDGALWIRTTDHGDDKDRVLIKSDGSYTYFLPDIAYHRLKSARGFEHAINVWGADHHGYVPRMQAALTALGLPGFLDVEVVQMVRIMRGGREMKLSKRSGEFVTLRELFSETGTDVARYFFLMRRGDTQMMFDLDLALDHSEKNPVYKVQYAHARMMSIFRKAGVEAESAGADADTSLLTAPQEAELIGRIAEFPAVVRRAAAARAPHMICEYLEAMAGLVNSWYHAGNPSRNPELAVLVADPELRAARLALARGVRIVLRNGLSLLGLSAPDRMEREESA